MANPEGYQTITPYFTVAEADKFIAFVEAVFNGKVIYENRYDNGKVQHARIQVGNSIIMLNEASVEYQANVSQMHLYVDDVKAVYERALAEGATSLMEPNVRPHGDAMAGVTDISGNIWWVASSASG